MITYNLERPSVEIDLRLGGSQKFYTSSSKGNQGKYFVDGEWVKVDYLGYEGIAEVLTSDIAKHTNITQYTPVVEYYLCHGLSK